MHFQLNLAPSAFQAWLLALCRAVAYAESPSPHCPGLTSRPSNSPEPSTTPGFRLYTRPQNIHFPSGCPERRRETSAITELGDTFISLLCCKRPSQRRTDSIEPVQVHPTDPTNGCVFSWNCSQFNNTIFCILFLSFPFSTTLTTLRLQPQQSLGK